MLIAWITDPMDGSALARGRRKDINSVIQSITSAPGEQDALLVWRRMAYPLAYAWSLLSLRPWSKGTSRLSPSGSHP